MCSVVFWVDLISTRAQTSGWGCKWEARGVRGTRPQSGASRRNGG